jgi:hypothetical protein
MQHLGDWHAEQLVFIDESASNERTLDRKFGWSPVGLPSREIRPAKRSARWSILPAYTLKGYITHEIVHGSFNGQLFNDFIANKVLPLCAPHPAPRSILIMDNASIHRSQVHQAYFQLCLSINDIGTSPYVRRSRCTSLFSPTLFARFQPHRGIICRIEGLDQEEQTFG